MYVRMHIVCNDIGIHILFLKYLTSKIAPQGKKKSRTSCIYRVVVLLTVKGNIMNYLVGTVIAYTSYENL